MSVRAVASVRRARQTDFCDFSWAKAKTNRPHANSVGRYPRWDQYYVKSFRERGQTQPDCSIESLRHFAPVRKVLTLRGWLRRWILEAQPLCRLCAPCTDFACNFVYSEPRKNRRFHFEFLDRFLDSLKRFASVRKVLTLRVCSRGRILGAQPSYCSCAPCAQNLRTPKCD
jgi:hypothetical protein